MRIDQLAIAILSPLAVWLTQQPGNERRQRWACVVGLVSQPFWFWSVWQSGDWGIGVGCVIYTVIWLQGAWKYWVAPRHGWPLRFDTSAGGVRIEWRKRTENP